MNFSLPFPDPTNDAERVATDEFLVMLATELKKALDAQQIFVGPNLDPVISEFERYFAGREQPPAVSALIRWYRESI